MPRVTRVEHARKSPGCCGKCQTKISTGEPYVWWQFAYSPKSIRCGKAECAPKAQDLTRSAYFQALYALQEHEFDASSLETLETERDEIAGELEQLRDEQQEKLDNMPDSLKEAPSGQTLQERYDSLDSAVSELQSVDISCDDGPDDESEDEKTEREADRLQEIADELKGVLDNIS
jgi:Skp family chaperone for outer membrane proteins